jgi:hypothetical protein
MENVMSDKKWNNAPEWANWLVRDEDGESWFFESEPHTENSEWRASDGKVTRASSLCQYEREWNQSKEKRPTSEYIPEIGEECFLIPHNNQWGFKTTGRRRGSIIGLNCDSFCFRTSEARQHFVSRFDKADFEEIDNRTEKQKQIDKIEKALRTTSLSGFLYSSIAEQLHSKGCRIIGD